MSLPCNNSHGERQGVQLGSLCLRLLRKVIKYGAGNAQSHLVNPQVPRQLHILQARSPYPPAWPRSWFRIGLPNGHFLLFHTSHLVPRKALHCMSQDIRKLSILPRLLSHGVPISFSTDRCPANITRIHSRWDERALSSSGQSAHAISCID